MNELADRLRVVTPDDETTAGQFDARLADSTTLIFRVAFSVLRQRQDAEDLTQEVLIRAHDRIPQLRDRDRFRSWVVRMAWRMALNLKRGQRRREVWETLAIAPEPSASADDALIREEQSQQLWAAIDRLPERFRLVIVLAAIEEHSLRDVARLLRIREGTVKSRLFEARKRLQELLCPTSPGMIR